MRQAHYTLSSAHIRHLALSSLDTVLPSVKERRKCPKQTLFAILLTAAVLGWSISATVKRRLFGCCYETARKTLHDSLPDRDKLTENLLLAMHDYLPSRRWIRRHCFNVAIDLHKRPWYGDPNTEGVLGGKEEHGTKYFWTYATAVLLHKGRRFTVAFCIVMSGRLEEILPLLFKQMEQAGVQVRKLLMDRQFYSGPVVEWLKERQIPFVLPLQIHGKRLAKLVKEGKNGEHFRYRFQPRRADYRLELQVCVVHFRQQDKSKKGKKKLKVMLLASWRLGKLSGRWLRQVYRRRFGIESSYRQLGQGLAKSSSERLEWRLLLVGLALLLRNLWIKVHWDYLALPRRGGRLVLLKRLPLAHMFDWLRDELNSLFPPINEVQTTRPIDLNFP
jgi:hypothetical protein